MMGQIFVEHPREVGETYFEHQRFAAGCGVMLLGAGAAAIVHAVVPCLFTRTAGNMVARLNQTLASRRIAASRGEFSPIARIGRRHRPSR